MVIDAAGDNGGEEEAEVVLDTRTDDRDTIEACNAEADHIEQSLGAATQMHSTGCTGDAARQHKGSLAVGKGVEDRLALEKAHRDTGSLLVVGQIVLSP